MKRLAALPLLVVIALLVVATARENATGRSEMEQAGRAAAAADWMLAITNARAAAEAVAPGSPWPERARILLDTMGREAEARGDESTALLAYGALRAAALATRVTGWTSALWRDKAEEGLARVAAASRDPSAPHVTAEAMRQALRENDPPPARHVALLSAGVLFLVAGFAFALRSR